METEAQLAANKIQQGDCIEGLSSLPAGGVDLVFADPPFNIGYEYDVYDDRRTGHEYLDWCARWMAGVARVLKPSGTFWLAIGDEYAAELKVLAQDKLGFTCRSWVIWYYTFGVNCVRGFSRSHTHLFHFVKDPERFTFNAENPLVRVLSARQLVYADNRANPKGRLPDNTWILRPQDAPDCGFAPMDDTWYFARVAGTFKEREGFHGCQMPEQLLGRIIRVSSNPGEIVLDPFGGSGTTLVTAKKLARQYIGFELSEEYVTRITERLEKTQVGDPLDGPADALTSAPTTAKGKSKLRLRGGRPVPVLDEHAQQQVLETYQAVCEGRSVDYLLCDKALNKEFVRACKKSGLDGNAYVWNRVLLRIRKQGEVSTPEQKPYRMAYRDMDAYLAGAEVAMHLLQLDYGMQLDDVLCSPDVAAEFDRLAAQYAPGKYSPLEYRWAALSIRKRATRSRKSGQTRYAKWLRARLPKPLPLANCLQLWFERQGVYVLASESRTLYVGETQNVAQRVEQILGSESWLSLAPSSITVLETENPAARHGIQSALIQRTKPLLNSLLLAASQP